MSVFGDYSRCYDLLYKDKDYEGEARFIKKILDQHAPGARTLLELGCGTGKHAKLLAQQGYSIHGVDMSQEMLSQAEASLNKLSGDIAKKLRFSLGDVRDFRCGDRFDAVLSLFHVVSYQTTNDDLMAALMTAKSHLKLGGIFVFDCWYGPAVLSDRPAVRVKRVSDDAIEVMRLAEPVMHPRDNVVDVNYQIQVRDKSSGAIREMRERHRMRYLFEPEMKAFLGRAGMTLVDSREWMTDREPGLGTWGVYFVCRG